MNTTHVQLQMRNEDHAAYAADLLRKATGFRSVAVVNGVYVVAWFASDADTTTEALARTGVRRNAVHVYYV